MIPFKQTKLPKVVSKDMTENVYAKLKTPIKHGAVMKFENDFTDSPSVFRHEDMF